MRALRQYSFCVRPLERQRSMWANILFRLRCRLVMIERLARSSDGYFRWTIWYCSGAYFESPFSQKLPAKENKARQDELKANLKKRGLICIDGVGKHPSNNWPGEVSVLVLGLDLEAAKSLGRHYEQHAFVWAAGDAAESP